MGSATAVYDALVESLGLAIVSGALTAGDRITLSEIETRHGVSRTVARDAIKTLTSLGLVETRRRAGIEVQARSNWLVLSPEVIGWRLATDDRIAQITSLTDVREAIEPLAARLAAKHADQAQAAQLVELASDLLSMAARGLGRTPEYLAADIDFHTLLLESSGNEMFYAMRGMVADVLRGRATHGLHPIWPELHAVGEHAEIAAAVQRGDSEAAELASRDQLRHVHQELARG